MGLRVPSSAPCEYSEYVALITKKKKGVVLSCALNSQNVCLHCTLLYIIATQPSFKSALQKNKLKVLHRHVLKANCFWYSS